VSQHDRPQHDLDPTSPPPAPVGLPSRGKLATLL